MNNPIDSNNTSPDLEPMELIFMPSWFKAIKWFTMIDNAGLYRDPPVHTVIKCQD